ncbi:hypothetical protein CYMTET_23163 [Cymbomonas tetramitiformis]|uniref:Uncharacterized protein n=1 Tax=Cymbomonas tetramitiformis TaxID=36881 RepID=A0AAE0FYR2_9CHLO|nr:hypothetical protein CYMTET_23163 [Cymbomonas tetramitiformis]
MFPSEFILTGKVPYPSKQIFTRYPTSLIVILANFEIPKTIRSVRKITVMKPSARNNAASKQKACSDATEEHVNARKQVNLQRVATQARDAAENLDEEVEDSTEATRTLFIHSVGNHFESVENMRLLICEVNEEMQTVRTAKQL